MTLHPDPAYPTARAFVLKLHRDGQPDAGIWQGRVEHIASGRHHDFRTSDELLFWLSCLDAAKTVEAAPCRSGPGARR
jgi:hypothetical protein